MKSRRDVLKAGLAGSALAAGGLPGATLAADKHKSSKSRLPKSMSLLVLGGTGFIGPHMVREALRRGHAVTLFNRGRTNNELFPDLETITGDRAGNLDGLKGRSWDAVVDNSGYMPQQVRASSRLLADNIEHYIFISSISAYASFASANNEDSPLASLDAVPDEFSWQNYGALKAISEKWAADEIGDDRYTVLRPTYICGPGDHTDRFTYWPVRASKGGSMLWPGSPDQPLQIIDVRDLANFVVDCLEHRTTGIYNTVTPAGSYTFGRFLEDSNAVNNGDASPVWVSDQFIADNNAGGLLPIYHPLSGDSARVSSVSGERARAVGLRNRPVRETIRDLMSWWKTLSAERVENARFGMTAEREAELIALWKASQA